tara:strand:+ start:908 stop:1114 length:207 start_codon:yes stop_codon:yes gene_type:complete
MNKLAKYVGVKGPKCYGCLKAKRHALIILQTEQENEDMQWTDWLLTKEQAETLYEQLGEVLEKNEKNE